jgi:hypothetical protein
VSIWRRRDNDILAIPLTPAEVELLVTALREFDRLHRIHFWTHDGSAWARSEAAGILRMAGTAAALGHPVVPALVQDLRMYDDCVLSGLQRYAADGQVSRDFGQLLCRMHALAGMARVRRWRVKHGVAGLQWAAVPTAAGASNHDQRALPVACAGSDAR